MSTQTPKHNDPKEIYAAFFAKVKKLAQENKMSLREVCEKIGKSPSFLSQMRTTGSNVTFPTLVAIANLFGVDWWELTNVSLEAKQTELLVLEMKRLDNVIEDMKKDNPAFSPSSFAYQKGLNYLLEVRSKGLNVTEDAMDVTLRYVINEATEG